MLKRLIAKGNIHKEDHLRALVTDTFPGDVPIIFSNDGFYKNWKNLETSNVHKRELLLRLTEAPRRYTLPYRYNILRTGGSTRRLSLVHPSSQIAIVDFYRDFSHLICYFSRKSEASIRAPHKVAGTFFVRGPRSERNAIKSATVDTVDLDSTVSNPASYFAYRGYNRAFKFFESADYMRLEKRYSVMYFADVSKCFSSIYTHTLYWAVADIQTAKDNTNASTFSNRFDKLMQSMNFNETNGICVGAEVSRVFAELILAESDRRAIRLLDAKGLKYRTHYEFRRYVDDFYIFAENQGTASRVLSAIGVALSEFNLHINEQKTQEVRRPFITQKSRMVRESNATLEAFFARFIEVEYLDGINVRFPKRIRRHRALLRSLLDSVKSACYDHASGYETTSNYIISALANRISLLIADHASAMKHDKATDQEYVDCLLLLLEAIYFFYNVSPTVPSSLKVAQAAIQTANFFKESIADRLPFLGEQIVRWTFQFIRSLGETTAHQDANCAPLEALNILLVLGEVGRREALAQQTIRQFCGNIASLSYFEIVSFLFCMGDDPAYDDMRESLLDRSMAIISGGLGVQTDSQAAHLALDLLACPHISPHKRAHLFQQLRSQVGLPAVSATNAIAAVQAFEDVPWFVNWGQADLLRMILKKELSAVY